jgi:hypothetical protein
MPASANDWGHGSILGPRLLAQLELDSSALDHGHEAPATVDALSTDDEIARAASARRRIRRSRPTITGWP